MDIVPSHSERLAYITCTSRYVTFPPFFVSSHEIREAGFAIIARACMPDDVYDRVELSLGNRGVYHGFPPERFELGGRDEPPWRIRDLRYAAGRGLGSVYIIVAEDIMEDQESDSSEQGEAVLYETINSILDRALASDGPYVRWPIEELGNPSSCIKRLNANDIDVTYTYLQGRVILKFKLPKISINDDNNEEIPDQVACPICLEEFYPESPASHLIKNASHTRVLYCGHKFHRVCISRWGIGRPCPLCRQSRRRRSFSHMV
jgi:hypothetical protein